MRSAEKLVTFKSFESRTSERFEWMERLTVWRE